MRWNSDKVVKQFCENIESVRTEKRISLTHLAKDAGITDRHLRRIINCEQDTTMRKADRIADALGFTLVGLINWRGKS